MSAALEISGELAGVIARNQWAAPEASSPDQSVAIVVELAARMGWCQRRGELERINDAVKMAVEQGQITPAQNALLAERKTRLVVEMASRAEAHRARYGERPGPKSYDRQKAHLHGRGLAREGWVPPHIANLLTPAQEWVAALYAKDFVTTGRTDDAKANLAVRAGTCERVAQQTQAILLEAGSIRIFKRCQPRRRGYSTIVEIVDEAWKLWLKNRRVWRENGPPVKRVHADAVNPYPRFKSYRERKQVRRSGPAIHPTFKVKSEQWCAWLSHWERFDKRRAKFMRDRAEFSADWTEKTAWPPGYSTAPHGGSP